MVDRVAFYIPSFFDGGVERFVVNIAGELAKESVAVDVLVNQTGPLVAEMPAAATLHRLATTTVLGWATRWRGVPPDLGAAVRSLPAYVRYLRRRDPDMIVVMRMAPLAMFGRALARSDATLVVRESNTPSVATEDPAHLVGRLAPLAKSLSYSRADKVVTVSEDAGADVREWLGLDPDQIEPVYNPTYTKQIEQQAKESVDNPWFDEDIPIVTSVGRFADQKDFETLLRAFARVCEDRDVRLVLVGDGENRTALEELVESLGLEADVWFAGYRTNPYRFVARSDLFVLSSHYEGLPNALIEAVAVGTPAIATDCPSGPREILLDGEGGTLVPVGDVEAMAREMSALLSDRDRARSELKRARGELERFTPERAAEQYLALAEGT